MKIKILILLMFFTLFYSCSKEKEQTNISAPAITGKIIAMEGEVFLNGKAVETDAVVPDQGILQTGLNSYCEVQFLGNNIIRIFEDSIIKIAFADATVTLDKGAAAAVLRNVKSLVQDMDDLFRIRSGTVVAGIRGTSFYMKREDATSAYFCLCNGDISLSDSKGNFSQAMRSSHHAAVRIREENNQVEVSKAPMLYHSDADMEALAAKIGQTMDWDRVEGSY